MEFTKLSIILVLVVLDIVASIEWPKSSVEFESGHYPPLFCHISNVVLRATSGNVSFLYHSDSPQHDNCRFATDVWPMSNVVDQEMRCDRTFKSGIAYTIFYWAGGSNYYHLTYDMLIPLFKHAYLTGKYSEIEPESVAFMPSVETKRLSVINMETRAFDDLDRYWVKMSEFIAGDFLHFPLANKFMEEDKTICFEEMHFGTPRVNFKDEEFIRAFVTFVKRRFGIEEKRPTSDRMALVSRKGRRKIVNEVELVEALQDIIPTDLLEFSGMTFEEQVKSVQKYTVFAALNGAGLMNCMYLPEHSVAIQMVPYKAGLNVRQYGDLIKNRGPYMEWHNEHEELHHPSQGDAHNNRLDTTVHIEEFKALVQDAILMSQQAYTASLKTEL